MSRKSRPSTRMGKGRSGGSSKGFVVVVALVLALGGYGFLLLHQLNFLVGRSLLVAFGDAETTYRSAWVDWDGDVTAKDVVLYPWGQGQPDLVVRFERVRVETPGWGWLLRSAFDKHIGVPSMERLHVALEGVQSTEGVDPSFGDLGVMGAVSASPFEAEGCMADGLWVREELLAMGLDPLPTTLDFDYRIADGQLHTEVVLDTPGVSTARLERREKIATGNALLVDFEPTLAGFERWVVQDHGFVEARNAFCAKKDGIDSATFVSRHLEAVSRLLETVGVAADAGTLAAYRDFAANGGEIAFGGDYVQPLPSEGFYEARESGEALARMQGIVDRGGKRLPVQWRRFDARPLPARADGTATYAALLAERDGGPAGLAATQGRATAGLASSLPASSTGDGVISHANLISPGSTVAWTDLGQLQGHWIQVWTAHNAPRHVMVLGMDRGQLQVRARLGGGHADYRITRDAFLRARLVQ